MEALTISGTHGTYLPHKTTAAPPPVQLQMGRLELVAHWSRCEMTSTFLGNYLAQNYVDPEVAGLALATIVRSLIESAVRHSAVGNDPITLQTAMLDGAVIIETVHSCELEQAARLRQWVERLNTERALFGASLGIRITETHDPDRYEVRLQAHLPDEDPYGTLGD